MYKLVLYVLITLLCVAGIWGWFGFISYSPIDIFISTLFLLFVCYVANKIFAHVFDAPANVESVYITALILALIITPYHSFHDLPFLGWMGLLAIASKYILAIGKKHIFNPVAISAVLCSYGLLQSASWWVGNAVMAPFVLVAGLLIVRKIRRTDLVFSFFFVTIVVSLASAFLKHGDPIATLNTIVFRSSLLFFAFIMLTEPLTTPPTKILQMIYGGLVGFLFVPQVHFGSIYSTPELALVIGNVFSYLVSPKQKLILHLRQKLQASSDMIEFIFPKKKSFAFLPGQYMEWTLAHQNTDSRGNRRYFTIASSPTEESLHLGVRFYPKSSSYKKAMLAMTGKTPIVGSQVAGDFTLPKDPHQKCVFIAGGIGITPYRSMLKYLIDTHQKRQIIMFYSNKTLGEIMYSDIFDQAEKELGIYTIYTLTDIKSLPAGWQGETRRIDAAMIQKYVPDYAERLFYLSGPHAMVKEYQEVLRNMGITDKQIKSDFFPGLV